MRDPKLVPTRGRRLIAGAAVALTIIGGQELLAGLAAAEGLAGWSQAQGDASHTGFVADAALPPYRASWHLSVPLAGPLSTFGLSAPVVDGSTVIAVGADSVIAADLATGRRLWTVDRDYGPPTSPAIAVAGKRRLLIYSEGFGDSPPSTDLTPSEGATGPASPSPSPSASTDDTFDSHVTAIDLASQEPAWQAPLQLREVSRTGVTIDGDTAFVGDNRGNVYAIEAKTGELRWTVELGGFLTTPVAVSDGLVIATVQGGRSARPRLVALDEADGSRSWDRTVEAGAVFASSPSVAGGLIVVGFSDQTVRAFDLADGTQRWTARMNGPMIFTGAVALPPDAVVAVDTFGQVYRLDPATGRRVWDFALNEPVPRSPAVVAGDYVLVATASGRMAAVDLATGLLVWETDLGAGILRGVTPTPITVVAVRGGPDAGLVGFAEDPEGRLTAIESPTRLELTKLLGAFLAAAVPIALLLMLLGRPLRVRMGPAFLDDDEAVTDIADATETVDDGA